MQLGNAQLLSSLRILKSIGRKGGPVSVEHPADPGHPPFPSIFITDEVLAWESELRAYRVAFPQCMWGRPALKLTPPTGTAKDMQRFVAPCSHTSHLATLCGKDDKGKFRSRVAQSYPSEFCQMLAQCHLDAMLEKGLCREEALTERAIEEMMQATLQRRSQDRTAADVLPPSFEAAAG